MTTSETFFFRSRENFSHLRDEALPALLRSRGGNRPVRIWCAGCSTGQEPYSIVILLSELGLDTAASRIEIVATDISTDSLARAREGIYSQFEVQRGLPVRLLLRHFDQVGERWQIKPKLRGTTLFRNFNLLSDPAPLGHFDIVLYRNVLIYFDDATRARVLERIAARLADDGFLYLGPDEVPSDGTHFDAVPRRRGAFTPAASAGRSSDYRLVAGAA
jgi:chemotaxis protein methyltransferase CheR